MRIHHLRLTAYGPFPHTVDIDFEELNQAGIFLLNGPTGSGKSSILDAICFALYGTTSLARPELKSHFAADDVEPRVELECTIGSAHLRIERSPKWERPKKRGTGTLTQQAKVLVERENPEQPGQWETKAERNDEAGKYITELIGLNREQFTQVMLLPQGEFARFLTSKSADREELLKRLFPTATFERVQQELIRRAKESGLKAERALHDVEKIADRSEQTLESSALDDVKERFESQLAPVAQEQDKVRLTDLLLEEISAEYSDQGQNPTLGEELAASEHRIKQALDVVRTAHGLSIEKVNTLRTEVQRLNESKRQWEIFEELSASLKRLKSQEEGFKQKRHKVKRAHAALQILPLFDAANQAEKKRIQAENHFAQAQAPLLHEMQLNPWLKTLPAQSTGEKLHTVANEVFTPDTSAELETLYDDIKQRAGFTEQLIEREKKLQQGEEQVLQLQARRNDHEKQVQVLEQQAEQSAQKLATTEKEQESLHRAEIELAEFTGAFDRTQKVVELSRQLDEHLKKLERKVVQAQVAEQNRQKLAHHAEALQNLRYAQAAQSLANQLEDNQPCPVCGSCQHPRPASGEVTQELVEESEVKNARVARNAAEVEAQETQTQLTAARATAENLQEVGAIDVEQALDNFNKAQARLEELKHRAHRATELKNAATKLKDQQESTAQQMRQKALEISRLESEIQVLQEQHQLERTHLETHRTELSWANTLHSLQRLLPLLKKFQKTGNDYVHAHQVEVDQQTLSQAKLQDSIFTGESEIRESALPAATLTKLEEEITTYNNTLSGIQARLDTPAQQDLKENKEMGMQPPTAEECELLTEQLEKTQHIGEQFIRWETQLASAHHSFQQLRTEHTRITARNEKLIETAQMHRRLADIAAGNTTDNRLAMSLTTFVLAAQLEEVALAATLHLESMTHGRFKLRHTDAKTGRGKSGLEIAVFDSWLARERTPATLSGGETFMASLALALGLADVVQQRNGGIEIDTLFVDEGFGTLDESTLEEVMGTLDNLREGGRVIGLISHVAEMKNRIPLHITLSTSPEGSTLETPRP